MPKPRSSSAKASLDVKAPILLAVICALTLYAIAIGSLGVVAKWGLAILALLAFGELIRKRMNFTRVFYGIYLMGGKHGIGTIERLSKSGQWFWKGLADWGMVLGFGLLSYLMFRKDISRRMIAFG
ncbi:MAG: hypothetical protein KGH50_04695, partial [Candidatus Micrarchaeota archaeon]|nr:hypothetical protein [Candidatus Micrarchaeota archaeon]